MGIPVKDATGQWWDIGVDAQGRLTTTAVAGPIPFLPVPGATGFRVDDIIEMAHKRSERKGENRLDMKGEFLTALQDLCFRRRWFWRRKRAAFNTIASMATYDLTTEPDNLNQNAVDVEQIIKVKMYKSSTDISELEPVFDIDEQEDAIEDTSQGQPDRFLIEPGTSQVLRLAKVPNGIYPIRVSYWAMPNMSVKNLPPVVPLVPGYLHFILIKLLEKQVFRYTLGEGSPKYQAAYKESEELIEKMGDRMDFAVGRVREYRDGDSQDSIRSTN